MTLFHAVVWLDHHQAEVLQFDPEHVQASQVKARSNHTRTHGNGVRTEHEFYGHVCDALQAVPEVLITGGKTSLKDFQHYVDKHRPALAPHIFGYEVVDHPSPAQLVALARRFFLKADRLAGVPVPS
jgi:stalled ribosome rescue protein Dom34